MIPVGAIGDRAPAMQPWATMIVIRKGGIRARSATAIARGAINAAVAMFPAPIDAMPHDSPKNRIGISPAFPRQPRTAGRTTRSSVPLPRASVNSSVTPTSVRNRSVGNPPRTSPIVKCRPQAGAR